MSAPPVSRRRFSLARISAITATTFTGLVRLKVFYFLVLFALLIIGSSLFLARLSFQQEFQVLKDVSLGAMSIFSSLLAIVATAQLIPRDIEESTVYTILAKPVTRFEYLAGKLAGVLLLLGVALLAMSALFFALLFLKQHLLIETLRQGAGLSPDQLRQAVQSVERAAFSPHLVGAIVIVYLKAALLASLTLFISTFASSSVFTIMLLVFIYFIGHLQGAAREYWVQHNSGGWLSKTLLALVALAFPDLKLFDLLDDVVAGTPIPAAVFSQTALLGCVYISVYLFFAWVVFYQKEL